MIFWRMLQHLRGYQRKVMIAEPISIYIPHWIRLEIWPFFIGSIGQTLDSLTLPMSSNQNTALNEWMRWISQTMNGEDVVYIQMPYLVNDASCSESHHPLLCSKKFNVRSLEELRQQIEVDGWRNLKSCPW